VLATSGPGIIYNRSTNSVMNTGTRNLNGPYQQGRCAWRFVRVASGDHSSMDKLRLMSESTREGGRVWVPESRRHARQGKYIPENERWYFLEESIRPVAIWFLANIATREIFDNVYQPENALCSARIRSIWI